MATRNSSRILQLLAASVVVLSASSALAGSAIGKGNSRSDNRPSPGINIRSMNAGVVNNIGNVARAFAIGRINGVPQRSVATPPPAARERSVGGGSASGSGSASVGKDSHVLVPRSNGTMSGGRVLHVSPNGKALVAVPGGTKVVSVGSLAPRRSVGQRVLVPLADGTKVPGVITRLKTNGEAVVNYESPGVGMKSDSIHETRLQDVTRR